MITFHEVFPKQLKDFSLCVFFLFHSSSINSVLLKTVPKHADKCNNDLKFGPDWTNKRN